MEGLMLASAGDDVKLWDSDQGFPLLHTFNPHCNRNIASVAWNFEGSLLASCALDSEQVTLTYIKNGALTTVDLPCGAGVQCTHFSSASRFLLCGGTEGVTVWDLKTKALKKAFKEHKGPVTAARYNWNDSYIASGSETGEIILHNTLTGQSSAPLVTPNVQAIRQLEYSPWKKSLFGTASDDGAVSLWDANTRRLLHSFRDAHLGPATGLAFSPVNEMLMMSVGLDKRFVCYDIQKKQILKVFEAQSPLTCIDIMSDGATAVVGSTRGKVYVYNVRQGGSAPVQVFQAHKTSVQAVKFTPSPKKTKGESSGGAKAGASTTTPSPRRQLPPAPTTVMQDITPYKTGQAPDLNPLPQTASPATTVDLFSPTVGQGNDSHHHHQSKSASHINLTAGSKEDSHSGLGIFSPLTRGAGDLSLSALSSTSVNRGDTWLNSFLAQNNSSIADHSSHPHPHHNHSTTTAASLPLPSNESSFLPHHHHHSPPTTTQQPPHPQQNANNNSNNSAEHLSHHLGAGQFSHQVNEGQPSLQVSAEGQLSHHVNEGQLSHHVNEGQLSHLVNEGQLSHQVSADGQLSHHVSAGHLSNLQQSGTVHSPAVSGRLPSPQMSSSLQDSGPDGQWRRGGGRGGDRERSGALPSQSSVAAAAGSRSHGRGRVGKGSSGPRVQHQFPGVSKDGVRNGPGSESPDSAALSGDEEGDAEGLGVSPRQTASSLPPNHYHHHHPPATNGGAAGPVVGVVGGGGGEAGAAQRDFLRSLVWEVVEDMRDDLHRDIQGLHVSVLRQFNNMEREMRSALSEFAGMKAMNEKLLMYVKQLEEENRKLKKHY